MDTIKKFSSQILYGVLILIALIIMFPRLFSAQFGLLDDGFNVTLGQQISAGDWGRAIFVHADAGRFNPIYWLYGAFMVAIAGLHPVVFFAASTISFLVTTVLWVGLVKKCTGHFIVAFVAGLVFVLSAPAIESYYTAFKTEPLQILGLIVSFILFAKLSGMRGSRFGLGFIAMTGAILFAMLSKETTVVIVPISICCWIINQVKRRNVTGHIVNSPWSTFVCATLVASSVFLILRFNFIPTSIASGNYTSSYQFNLSSMITTGRYMIVFLASYFPYLAILVPYAIWQVSRRPAPANILWQTALIWMFFWLVIFLPWRSMTGYFLLPFTLGVALLTGLVVRQLVYDWWGESDRVKKGISSVLLMGISLLVVLGLLASHANAQVQLLIDQSNYEMIQVLAHLPTNSTVGVSLPENMEYVDEISIHLNIFEQRSDIQVMPFNFNATMVQASDSYYLVVPKVKQQPLFLVRQGFSENHANESATRIVDWQDRLEFDNRIEHSVTVFQPRWYMLGCELIQFDVCATLVPVVGPLEMTYGWQIYHVK